MKVMLTPASDRAIMIVDGEGGYISLTESGADDCECCPVAGPCDVITDWRIRDVYSNVDEMSGPVEQYNNVAGVLKQNMMNFPQPWGVPHYNRALPIVLSMVLEVKCMGEWKKIDEWDVEVGTCTNSFLRFHYQTWGDLDPPAPCDCARDSSGECGEPLSPCPPIAAGSQYDPPNMSAYEFTAAIDGEWTNLKNWKDSAGASPASELPGLFSTVVIDGVLDTIPPGLTPTVHTVLVTANGQIRIPFHTSHAVVRGVIGVRELAEEECGSGVLVMAGADPAEFKGAGYVEEGAEVTGNANFNDTSHNNGTVTGDGEFTGTATNETTGVVKGTAIFESTSINKGHVEGVATFTENARNKGTCEVDATFSGGATNDIDGIVEGDGTFGGGYNWGMVEGDATFSGGGGNGTGGPGSGSPITGTVKGDATFAGSSNAGIVEGDAAFSAGGDNLTNGTVQGNATFTASDNYGTVDGTATFNITGTNWGHVTGLATFEEATHNGGFADGDAIFWNTSENDAAGSVAGTATFNDDSNNYGINGTTVCNTTGNCP